MATTKTKAAVAAKVATAEKADAKAPAKQRRRRKQVAPLVGGRGRLRGPLSALVGSNLIPEITALVQAMRARGMVRATIDLGGDAFEIRSHRPEEAE